jgi:hypothetical protein
VGSVCKVPKEKQRRAYREQFAEGLNRSGRFPNAYIQELAFAYTSAAEIFHYQPYLKR